MMNAFVIGFGIGRRGGSKHMRLWHKDLISVLPRQQLLGQNRECALMLKDIMEKGEVNHILINFVNEYSRTHLYEYYCLVLNEMEKRGYKISNKTRLRVSDFKDTLKGGGLCISYKHIFSNKMNDIYLTQCYYNLQEKHDCGGITDEEWEDIEERYNKRR